MTDGQTSIRIFQSPVLRAERMLRGRASIIYFSHAR